MPKVERQSPTATKKSGVLNRIAPIKMQDHGIKICCYGASGTGKTTLLGTYPKPLLHIVCSGAQETLSIHNVKGIDTVTIADEAELAELVEYQRSTDKYKTVGLDHVSSYQDLVLKKVLSLEKLPSQLAWGTATQGQWGDTALGMKERLRDLLDLNCNVVINSQQREFNTDSESDVLQPYVSTALSPSVTGWLCPAVDYLVNTFIRQQDVTTVKKVGGKDIKVKKSVIQYCLRVGPHHVYATKFRLPKGTPLPDVIVDPNFTKISNLIKGNG